jgi:DNA repair exonuclease SbcCD ATPase subunit
MQPSLTTYPKGALMTIEEMFQLLLNKFTDLTDEVKEMRSDIKRLEQGQAKLEQGQAQLEQGQVRLEAKIDAVQNTQDNMRLGIRNLRRIVDEFRTETNQKFDKQAKSIKFFDKSLIHFHDRVSDVEETVEEIKQKLDKAS